MPANNFTFITSISGSTGTTGPTVTPSEELTVLATVIRRTGGGQESPPFSVPGGALEVLAEFEWFLDGLSEDVQGFSVGDIRATAENSSETEDLLELGYANPAGAAFGALSGGPSVYELPLFLNANSAGTIHLTVFANAASTIPVIGVDTMPIYGPLRPFTLEFNYSTLLGIEPTSSKPEVDIVVPSGLIYSGATPTITLLWNKEIKQKMGRTIGSAEIDDIRITGATYTSGFTRDSRTMAFPVTLTGSGTCTIRVKANSETDTVNQTGPATDVTESFLYDTMATIGNENITGTNVGVIYDSGNVTYTNTSNPILGLEGGAFKGVSDLKLIDGNIYGTAQTQRSESLTMLDQGREARGVLFRVPNELASSITALEEYNSIADSARSFVNQGDQMYYFTGSHVEDSSIGELRSVEKTSTSISNYGVPWRSRLHNPNAITREDNLTYSKHIRMASPMVTQGNNLYLNCGYGEPRSAKSTRWESYEDPEGTDAVETRIDNWTTFKYGSRLDFRPSIARTNNRNGYDIIRDLANLCFCYIGFDGDTFIVKPKYQPRAALTIAISASDPFDGSQTMEFENPNVVFPSSGILEIIAPDGSELFEYTGITNDNTFTGVKRAAYGTSARDHRETSIIRYLDHIIDMEEASYSERPINELNIKQDLQQLYNIIKIKYGDAFLDNEEIAKDQDSIDSNKPRELEFEIDLTHHDSEWATWLAERYRDFYGPVQSLLELQLKPSFHIKVSDFILIRERRNSTINNQTFQVLKVNHEIKPYLTNLQLRSIF